jgi:hypothetical protein
MGFQTQRIADRFLHSLPGQQQFVGGWRHSTRGKMTALWAEPWYRRWFESLISITSRT